MRPTGLLLAAIVCSGAGDSYTYDALGRVKTITHGDSSTVTLCI